MFLSRLPNAAPRVRRAFVTNLLGIVGTILLAAPIPSVIASENEPSKTVSVDSFLDEETAVVLQLDVEAIRPRELAEWAHAEGIVGEPLPPPVLSMMEMTRASLQAAGARQVFLLVTTRNLIHGSMLLIPCSDTDGVHALLSMGMQQVPERYGFRTQRREGLVGVSTDAAWRELEQRLARDSEDTDAEMRGRFSQLMHESSLPHRLTISLPARHRDELALLWPDQLPSSVPLSLSPRQSIQDIDALSLQWQLPPQLELRLRVAARDHDAAARVAKSLQQVVELMAAAVGRNQPVDNASKADDDEATSLAMTVDIDGEDIITVRFASDNLLRLLKSMPTAAPLQQNAAMNQLKQIGLAMHNFYNNYQYLPPRATVKPDGTGLLSWRVQLLPYLDQQALHNQFHVDEPWDSPANRMLSEIVVPTFNLPGDQLPAGHTRIRLPVLEGSLWQGDGPPRKFSDVTDGTSNTIAAAIAPPDRAVPWTKPDPWELDPENMIDSFFGEAEETIVLFLDGSVRKLPRTIDPKTLRAMLTHAGGEVITP